MVQTVLIALNTFVSYMRKYPASIIWFPLFYIYFAILTVHVFRPVTLSLHGRGLFHPLSSLRVGSVSARMNAVIHLQVPRKGGNLFTSLKRSVFRRKKNCSIDLTESRLIFVTPYLHVRYFVSFRDTDTGTSVSFGVLAALTVTFLSLLVFWLHWHWYSCPF
jgi:hypothetical protein